MKKKKKEKEQPVLTLYNSNQPRTCKLNSSFYEDRQQKNGTLIVSTMRQNILSLDNEFESG